MAEPLELNIYCPHMLAKTILVASDTTSLTIQTKCEALIAHIDTIYFVTPGTVKWSESEDDMLHALKQCDLRDRNQFAPLSRRNHTEWLKKISDMDSDLHLVVTTSQYPSITILNIDKREVVQKRNIASQLLVAHLLPGESMYTVYKCPEGMAPPKSDTVATLVDSLKLDTMKEVKFSDRLNTLFPWGPMPAVLHFVITAWHYAAEDEDTLEPLPYHEQRRRYFKATSIAAPSSEGSPQNFRDTHSHQDRKIYCGRPDELSAPPSLLDETLCQLRSDLKSIKPSPNDIRCYNALRQVACVIYNNEGERRKAFMDTLREYGILPMPFSSGKVYPGYTTDSDLRSTCQGEEVLSFLQEIKNEVSAGGKAEPSFEALLYWVATVRRILDAKTTKGEDWEQVNFPAILVMHFGPYLAIAAATYVMCPNVEHMCCIPLHVHSTNVAELEAGERAIAALRVAVHSLLKRYPTLHTRAHRGDFPFRDYYMDGSAPNIKHYFEYLEAIDKKRIFRVTRKSDGKLLCVKFSTHYSADAHRKAHELGLAPALRAVNYVGEWIMVVMDDMSKKYANTMYALRAEQPIPRSNPALSLAAARELVEKKLPALHAAGFVHGDVRTVNVLVRNEDAAPEPAGADVLLVDFDWAGPVGETVYPRRMNPAVERPEGAQSGEVITTEHDILMAQRLY